MDPIYPDKTKTGLAALKPLTDVFFAGPERWTWERKATTQQWWYATDVIDVMSSAFNNDLEIRLTPKPRRVWIGDQSYPEPLGRLPERGDVYLANISINALTKVMVSPWLDRYLKNGIVFDSESAAQQCLDAHRRARRVE